MTKAELNERNELVVTGNGYNPTIYNSFAEMINCYDDLKNTEVWAISHKKTVFLKDRFNTYQGGCKIVEHFNTKKEADRHADNLNQIFAIQEKMNVDELEEWKVILKENGLSNSEIIKEIESYD